MERQYEPAIEQLNTRDNMAYVFSKIPHWSDSFGSIHVMRSFLVDAFNKLISQSVRDLIGKTPSPMIAAHVRRGDFRELALGEKFAAVGGFAPHSNIL